MNRKVFVLSATALVAASMLSVASANPMSRTEIRDPIRGVSFDSVEISEEQINSLEVIEGSFGDSDSLVVGLSAMTFDGNEGVDEYILWLRHEGRRWLQFDIDDPVIFEIDGQRLELEQLRASQPFIGASSRMFEKVEFRLNEEDFQRLIKGNEITILLRSETGIVEKTLLAEQIDRIREFHASMAVNLVSKQ